MTFKRDAIYTAAEELSNWGRWGDDDQIGTLNNIEPQDIAAAGLIRKGKVFALGLSLKEPIQSELFGGRWNPIHQMLATGTDAAVGKQDGDGKAYLRYADDAVNMPCQASTQWDALCHIFLDDKMYNGYPATDVTVQGAARLGIEKVRDKMVGRGVLLDIARFKGVDCLDDGYGITNADLDAFAEAQGVEIRKGDFVIVRIDHQERCLKNQDWSGYAGGDAQGLAFETAYWIRGKDIAAICADTWGCEVRLNETDEANQP